MKTFTYSRAESPEAAVAAGGRFIAGGTNLLDLMKLQIETPEKLVDISRLDLARVERRGDGGLTIGALVPNSDLAANMQVIADYPVLSRALLAGASGQLRNKATTGGNLLQRTRFLLEGGNQFGLRGCLLFCCGFHASNPLERFQLERLEVGRHRGDRRLMPFSI